MYPTHPLPYWKWRILDDPNSLIYNVPIQHCAFEFELLCNNVAARLLQGCHKVENSFKSKVVSRLWTGSNNLVTATWSQGYHTLVTPLSQA